LRVRLIAEHDAGIFEWDTIEGGIREGGARERGISDWASDSLRPCPGR
jgi:hypothetical protein